MEKQEASGSLAYVIYQDEETPPQRLDLKQLSCFQKNCYLICLALIATLLVVVVFLYVIHDIYLPAALNTTQALIKMSHYTLDY